MKTVITIKACMRSTRLPGKVLRPNQNRPMLAIMIEWLKNAWQIDQIVVVIMDGPFYDQIANLA